MTELERTQVAYAHFTLDEWKLLATLVAFSAIPDSVKMRIMSKMPSASLPQHQL